jgi:hypothetical protein
MWGKMGFFKIDADRPFPNIGVQAVVFGGLGWKGAFVYRAYCIELLFACQEGIWRLNLDQWLSSSLARCV